MRSKPARVYSSLFFLSGATGLIYELLWVRVLYQSFGSTIQSVTHRRRRLHGRPRPRRLAVRPHRPTATARPAVLYGRLEIAIGVFGVLSPLVLGLTHWLYLGTAGASRSAAGASVALRFGLAALVLLIPRLSWAGHSPVLTRAFTGEDRSLLSRRSAGSMA